MSCSPPFTSPIASTSDAFSSNAHTQSVITKQQEQQSCSKQELRFDNSEPPTSTEHHVASLFNDSSSSKNIQLNSNNDLVSNNQTKTNSTDNVRHDNKSAYNNKDNICIPNNDGASNNGNIDNNDAQSSSNIVNVPIVRSAYSPPLSPASNPFPESNKFSSSPINPTSDSCEQIVTKQQPKHQQQQAGDIIHHHPVFVKDTSKYWYKPTISREEAINMLRDKPPGTFVVRDSNSFPGAFGLALKVATPPPGIHSGDGTELVRHFLIEPSPKGVKLKGCNNEPIFGTLSALVYQHSITALALPTKLLLPDYDPASTPEHISAAQALLQQGAACNVTYIASLDTESLTGPEAVRRCIGDSLELYNKKMVQPVSVHFKVSSQGVTVTDNTRRLFFRRHYPVQSVTFAGIDPADRRWDNSCISNEGLTSYVKSARMFAFVARKIGSRTDNACHVFAELEPEQPASAVVNFITKVMMGRK